MNGPSVIAQILRYELKTASYKFALIRGLNEVIALHANLQPVSPVAVPLKRLVPYWIAYYWPFMLPPGILQARIQLGKQDVLFRRGFEELQTHWHAIEPKPDTLDGYRIVYDMSHPKNRATLPPALQRSYERVAKSIVEAIKKPIQFTGNSNWSVFPKPSRWGEIQGAGNEHLPNTHPRDLCVLVVPEIWRAFASNSSWIETLAVRQWCLFTEKVSGLSRDEVYGFLLPPAPGFRPLTWDESQLDIEQRTGLDLAEEVDPVVIWEQYEMADPVNAAASDKVLEISAKIQDAISAFVPIEFAETFAGDLDF